FSDSGDGSTRGSRPSTRKQLQGPRPTALKINQDSYKIKKPPIAPPPPQPPDRLSAPETSENRHPVIIYAVSPKIIHTNVSDFMSLVQRLTGSEAPDPGGSGSGDVSPAARLASIERISPRKLRGEAAAVDRNGALGDLLIEGGVEFVGGSHGILSPSPESLAPISGGHFSPAASMDPPLSNMFLLSPSTLFSAPLISPSPTSFDTFKLNPFFDF
ncbi:hypothetical protein M569_10412, partial [Genlisea aurea]